jgi:malate dehydrogenase (oxaloacetate-decarboxylating)(NADP+)
MGRVYQRAARAPQLVVFADGEDERVLRAVRAALDERMIRRPHVIGRIDVVTRVVGRCRLTPD